MYMTNAALRSTFDEYEYDDEMKEELIKCMNDPIYFIENYIWIVDKKKTVLFELRPYQKTYLNLIHENKNVMCMWGRQSGKSVSTAAYITWKIIFNPNVKVLLLADQQDKALEQLKRIKDMIEKVPLWMQMGVKKWAEKRIIFSNNSEVRAAATHAKAASGYTVNFLYLDEFALVDDKIAHDFMSSVFPTVSSDPDAKIAITSCVTADTMVYTNKGIKQIGDFVIDKRPDGFGYEVPEYKVQGMRDELNTGVLVHNDGMKETRIISSKYAYLESSLEHKYHACKNGVYGTYRARELEVGDFIAIRHGMNTWGDNRIISKDLAYFAGLYIAGGSDHELVSSENLTKALRLMVSICFDVTQDRSENVIPSELLEMPRDHIIALLQGLFDCAGYVYEGSVKIALESQKIIQQIRVMLINLGILSTYTVYQDKHLLEISGIYAIKFNEIISSGIQTRKDELKTVWFNKKCEDVIPFASDILNSLNSRISLPVQYDNHVNRDVVTRICEVFKLDGPEYEEFAENLRDGITWTPITKIEKGCAKVYDFSLNPNLDDKWHDSVVYAGILGRQTPRGKNNFYRMWEQNERKARAGVLTREDFLTFKIRWNDVPGRDEAWRQGELNKMDEIAFKQEYDCIAYEESVTIRNIETGEVFNISIGDLYQSILYSNGLQLDIVFNNKYEILTPDGFSPFDGVRKSSKQEGIRLLFSNGQVFRCTKTHKIKTIDGAFIFAIDSKGVNLGDVTVIEVNEDEELEYYDILETNTHEYYSSGIVSHNCVFEGSLATLIPADHITSMKNKYMTAPLNVLDEKRLRIFAWPIAKRDLEENNYEYVISVDPAMGTGQDYTVAQVWLVRSNTDIEQVAVYQSNDVSPDSFVSKILALCKMYHTPYVIVETMEPAGGIIVSRLIHDNDYYNVINMQKDGIGFRMTHEAKIKACTLLQVYCSKQAIKIRDELTYGEIEMFGKKNNTYKAIGETHDDCVMATLGMLFYVNSPHFYGNMDAVSIHRKKSTMIVDELDNTEDVLIKEALDRMKQEDDIKGGGGYSNSAIVVAGSSKVTFEDATRWKDEHIPDQRNNQMFNPNAHGNVFWHNRYGF